jgi:hypothetical protein
MTKCIYDQLQEFDRYTPQYSVVILVAHNNSERKWDEIVMHIHGSVEEDAPLHLKIKAYHDDIARGHAGDQIECVGGEEDSDSKHVVPQIPEPWPFQAVRAEIVRRAQMYGDLILKRTTEDQYQLLEALDLYESFYYVRHETSWGKLPFGCICKWCCKWTICEHTALLTSVFDPEVQVPVNLVAETQALRKKCSNLKVRGTAGQRKARLLKQIAKQKKQSVSKIVFVDAPVPPVPDAAAPPAAALPDGAAAPPAPTPPPVKDIPGPAQP